MIEPGGALSTEQLVAFRDDGFVHLPGLVPPPLLARLHALFDELLVPGDGTEQVLLERGSDRVVVNLDTLCPKGNLAVLELLGLPAILAIARAICGDDFFLIQEFAVIKHRGDDNPVLWHQDMVHGRTGECFTMGIYLDPSFADDGALRVVPGSHVSGRDICALRQEPFVEVPVAAGDALIHDMMLAHSSEPMRAHDLRRVIYFEFLSARHVLGEEIYSADLVERRTRLLFAACRLHAERNPEEPAFDLARANPCADDANRPLRDVLDEIHSQPINARPSAYCFDNISLFSQFGGA